MFYEGERLVFLLAIGYEYYSEILETLKKYIY